MTVRNYPFSLLNRLAKRFVFESPSVDESSLVIWQAMWRVRGKIGFGEFDRSVGMCLEVDPRLRGWLRRRSSSNHNLHDYITLTYSFCSHKFGYPSWHTALIYILLDYSSHLKFKECGISVHKLLELVPRHRLPFFTMHNISTDRIWHKWSYNSLNQCFSTAGPRPSTGPWHQLYRAARGSPGICHFSFLSIFHE